MFDAKEIEHYVCWFLWDMKPILLFDYNDQFRNIHRLVFFIPKTYFQEIARIEDVISDVLSFFTPDGVSVFFKIRFRPERWIGRRKNETPKNGRQ
jgi:hypothetical protein